MVVKRQQRSLIDTMELYSHIQSSTFSAELHQGPRPLVWIVKGLGKSIQQQHTTQDYFISAVKLVSVLMYHRVYGKKLNFLSWAVGGWMAGKGYMKKCRSKVERWNGRYGPRRADYHSPNVHSVDFASFQPLRSQHSPSRLVFGLYLYPTTILYSNLCPPFHPHHPLNVNIPDTTSHVQLARFLSYLAGTSVSSN